MTDDIYTPKEYATWHEAKAAYDTLYDGGHKLAYIKDGRGGPCEVGVHRQPNIGWISPARKEGPMARGKIYEDIWNPVDNKYYSDATRMRKENEARGYVAIGDQKLDRKPSNRPLDPEKKREIKQFMAHCVSNGVPEHLKAR